MQEFIFCSFLMFGHLVCGFVQLISCSLLLHLVRGELISDPSWTEVPPHSADIPQRCIDLQTNYSQSIAAFTKCALRSSRPLSVCLHCVHLRRPVNIFYRDIQQDAECSRLILGSQFGTFIGESRGFYESLLQRSQCHLCEQRSSLPSSASLPHSVSVDDDNEVRIKQQVLDFVSVHELLVDCLQDAGAREGAVSDLVCDRCSQLYTNSCLLLERCVLDVARWHTCRDVIDRANTTMHIWESAGCLSRQSAHLPSWTRARAASVTAAVVVCLAALALFYCGAVMRHNRQQRATTATTQPPTSQHAAESPPSRRVRQRRMVYTPLN